MRPILIITGVVILVALIVLLFIGFIKPNNKPVTGVVKTVVLADDAAGDLSVRYTLDGITRGNELHQAIRITVTKNSRMLEVITGYEGAVKLSQSFTNNADSFKSFLTGLQTLGYLKQRNATTGDNYLGQCPLGYRYIFENSGLDGIPSVLWTTNCSSKTGTFAGSLSSVQRLFQNQIPKYDSLVSGVKL